MSDEFTQLPISCQFLTSRRFLARLTSFTPYVSHNHKAVGYVRGCFTRKSLIDATPAHHFSWQGVSTPQQKQLHKLMKNFPLWSKPHMSMSLSKKA